jgi:hypothetical protein
MIPDPAHAALTMTFKTPPNVTNYSQVFHSVADPGCLSWIPDPNFSFPDKKKVVKRFYLDNLLDE